MIKAVIIEDEPLTANRLKRIVLKVREDIEFVAMLQTVKESLEWLDDNEEPDLYFMDIQLSDGLSFDIFSSFDITKPVIFTTAFDEYAIKAFKANGIDYLLKPINEQDIVNSLEKYQKFHVVDAVPNIKEILGSIAAKQPVYRSNFLVEWRDRLLSIPAENAAYFYVNNKTTYLVTVQGKQHVIGPKLDGLDRELDPTMFFRINRQIIVSRKSIREIHIYFGKRLKLYLEPAEEMEIIVSRERVLEFRAWLDS